MAHIERRSVLALLLGLMGLSAAAQEVERCTCDGGSTVWLTRVDAAELRKRRRCVREFMKQLEEVR